MAQQRHNDNKLLSYCLSFAYLTNSTAMVENEQYGSEEIENNHSCALQPSIKGSMILKRLRRLSGDSFLSDGLLPSGEVYATEELAVCPTS
jgi:hypothetical protein